MSCRGISFRGALATLFHAWTLLVNVRHATGGAAIKKLTPESFDDTVSGLADGQRLFIDFTTRSMYDKVWKMAAETDESDQVIWAQLDCGPHHEFCHGTGLRPWNALRLFFSGGTSNDFVEFPSAILSETNEDDRWKKLLEFSKVSSEESAEDIADSWKSEWASNRPVRTGELIEQMRDDNFEEAFEWMQGHESRQLFMVYTGIQKPCEDKREKILDALKDLPLEVPVRVGVVNCDTDHKACMAASVAAYCFINHFMIRNACPLNVGGPRGSAHFRGQVTKEALLEAIHKEFSGKPLDEDYQRRGSGETKNNHDEL